MEYYASFVNLDHRQDRLQHMNYELSKAGIQAVRERGRKPEECDLNNPKHQVMKNRTPGAIGCHVSQVEIMRKAKELDLHAFVMEDDLVFCSDFQKRLSYIENFLSRNEWDVFWLGGTFHVNPPYWHRVGKSNMPPDCSAQIGRDAELTSDPRILRTYGAFCTYAYLVNKDSIDKIQKLFDGHLHYSIGIDWLFIKLQPQLKTFAFVPGCVKQMDNQSDIGNGITRFSGFSRLNGTEENSRYWFQDKMEDFDPSTFNWAECRR